MDDRILLSIINTKLRDFYDSLDSLCEDLDYDKLELIEKFNNLNYYYNKEENQFKEKL